MAEPNCVQILQAGRFELGQAKYALIVDQAIQKGVVFASLVDVMQRIFALTFVTDREYPKYAKNTFQFIEKFFYEVSCVYLLFTVVELYSGQICDSGVST